MTVAWDAPSVGEVTGYNVTLQGSGTFLAESVTKDNTTVEFRELKAGSVYTVGVVTVLGELQSATVDNDFYTGTCTMNLGSLYVFIFKYNRSYYIINNIPL